MSVVRITRLSVMPPAQPAINPSVEPITKIISAGIKPATSEERVPYRMRLSTSRPCESVPSGKVLSGAMPAGDCARQKGGI